MKKSLSVVRAIVAFLFAFAVSFNALTSNAWALGGFSQTCEDISITGSTLSASCERENGRYQNTKINLNQYIGNDNGTLSWNDKNFNQTCRDLEVSDDNTLEAECKTIDQDFNDVELNLDEHIANIDGNLQYE